MTIKLRKTKNEIIATFSNGKQICFLLQDTKLVRQLMKESVAIAWLCDRVSKLGAINNLEIPSFESVEIQRQEMYVAIKNAIINLLNADYNLQDVINLETLILSGCGLMDVAEFAIAGNAIKSQISDAIRIRSRINK